MERRFKGSNEKVALKMEGERDERENELKTESRYLEFDDPLRALETFQ